MRRISSIFLLLLGAVSVAEAQQLKPDAKVELSINAGLLEAKPNEVDVPYYDDWYAAGRYSGSIGYFWTRHLKTEYEYSWSHEGSRQIQDYLSVGGQPYPYYFEEFHQLQQHALRMTYQFGDNQWVHPYVSAGAVLDVDHRHVYVPVTYQPNGRGGITLVHRETDSDRGFDLRPGVSVGAGAKFYMTQRSFFNAGAITTFSKPAATLSLIAGFGIEF